MVLWGLNIYILCSPRFIAGYSIRNHSLQRSLSARLVEFVLLLDFDVLSKSTVGAVPAVPKKNVMLGASGADMCVCALVAIVCIMFNMSSLVLMTLSTGGSTCFTQNFQLLYYDQIRVVFGIAVGVIYVRVH